MRRKRKGLRPPTTPTGKFSTRSDQRTPLDPDPVTNVARVPRCTFERSRIGRFWRPDSDRGRHLWASLRRGTAHSCVNNRTGALFAAKATWCPGIGGDILDRATGVSPHGTEAGVFLLQTEGQLQCRSQLSPSPTLLHSATKPSSRQAVLGIAHEAVIQCGRSLLHSD